MRIVAAILAASAFTVVAAAEPQIEIWHGDRQRVGHRGNAQDDFNVLGHVEPWREVDTLRWSLNRRYWTPVSFRSFRRLVEDGDFNVDVPVATLQPGENVVTITARLLDGSVAQKVVMIVKEAGENLLPMRIDWAAVRDPQDVGQYVDGRWTLADGRLRTAQVGYDRVFLIGDRTWRDYEVQTSFTVHAFAPETGPHSGGHGVGLILRFAGHVSSGQRNFASGQPKWGYQPFGAIGWLRWKKNGPASPPSLQFYPGDSDRSQDFGSLEFKAGETYAVRFRCTTLPDAPGGEGVTRYDFKLWRAAETEPTAWTWQQTQISRDALRTGGVALLAHHVNASFGPVSVTELGATQ